jgi:hypothetical protein
VSAKDNDIQISEGQLRAMTTDLDGLNSDQCYPAMTAAAQSWAEDLADQRRQAERPRHFSRRSFLFGAGGAIAGGVVLATTSSSLAAAATRPMPAAKETGDAPKLTGDLAVAALAASLENLAIFAYTAGLNAAKAGKLGAVPPAVPTFVTTARSQHTQHAAAWNSVLTAAGYKAVTYTDPALTPMVEKDFAAVKNIPDLLNLALTLENVAAQTYQGGADVLKSTKAIAVAASIQPVEMQHAAILYFVLGKYPGIQTASGTPLAFNPLTLAQKPSS